MPESIKTPAKTKFPKCEPCQSRLSFIEAYRAMRALESSLSTLKTDIKNFHLFNASQKTIEAMVNSMPYGKAQYYQCAQEVLDTRDLLTKEERKQEAKEITERHQDIAHNRRLVSSIEQYLCAPTQYISEKELPY
ncbi:hypothetical protein [Photobacterium halotolerans]|uniref:Uncharacterized protein n=1 Tax=Photobacterium halotolerans TaxID=265726 RepID=A0A7X4WF86_9GAMM|nr:hypothetical protein [Photobacterium halotolerans]NAW67656.1 hypothetical protein [Photobacterium halotolerans]